MINDSKSNLELNSPEPVRYVGGESSNDHYHDGQLRTAVGVHSYQVLRANRAYPDEADGFGWTQNHAPMLTHWRGRFYLEYLSTPVSENVPPGQALLVTSEDGRHWSKPVVAFPPYTLPEVIVGPEYGVTLMTERGYHLAAGTPAMAHHRMGFYVAPDDRLLILSFFGPAPEPAHCPNHGEGVGRVVREVYPDGSMGPIYFLRFNRHDGWNEQNTNYPLYTSSSDGGFVAACQAFIDDKLMMQQCWEEDKDYAGPYPLKERTLKAFCYFSRQDGQLVGLWKWRKAALSPDHGRNWSQLVELSTVVHAAAKIWGQQTSDGRYALVYNPSLYCRYPLAIVTGDDGETFDQLRVIQGEAPPRRFDGYYKESGPQYVRGIEGYGENPPDGALWITYSMNKEDIWVSRIPVPVQHGATEPVNDCFSDMETGGLVTGWNIYSPVWASVSVVDDPASEHKSLELLDEDPYDYAKAERVFPTSRRLTVHIRVLAKQNDTGMLAIELLDARGNRPVQLWLDADGYLKGRNGRQQVALIAYAPDQWLDLQLSVDAEKQSYDVRVNGIEVLVSGRFAEWTNSVERLVLRTGAYRGYVEKLPQPWISPDLPDADTKVPVAVFHVGYVSTTDHL